MVDIAILTVPGIPFKAPQSAPAILKAACVEAGFTCKTLDFNIRVYHDVPAEQQSAMETYFCTGEPELLADNARTLVSAWAEEVAKLNPKNIGISVFSYQSRVATRMFCEQLRLLIDAKIILGGQGIATGSINGDNSFAEEMVQAGLVDHWIRSEGEVSIVELLRGNLDYPGIDSSTFNQIENLDSIPVPDYSDYEFHLYAHKLLPINGSRGCVRACSFCDVHDHWKYRYRSGEHIYNEMITLSRRWGISFFYFNDSLVNGNLKEFRKLCALLADYNRTAETPIEWRGQYIVREQRHLTEEYWANLAASGAKKLAIGIESGSDQVRLHMNKKFTNVDIDYTMQMLDKYGITCMFLMIIGYPTETEKDFQDTLDMMTRYKPLAGRIIVDIAIGSTLAIFPGTPLHYQAKEYNIELDVHENNWIAWDNPELTLAERLRRRHAFKKHVLSLGYDINLDDTEMTMNIIESNLDKFDKRSKVKKLIKLKNIK